VPVNTDIDLLQQALTNSGLSNGNVTSSAASSVTVSESVSAHSCTNKDATTLADASCIDEPSSLASSRPAKLSLVSTMAVHDSVTGVIRRHPIRKVVFCMSQWNTVGSGIKLEIHVYIYVHSSVHCEPWYIESILMCRA